ncbi:hypothetical protein TYRP_023789 [Tyrophagus putrescentiae]|nr:hypothetical protein TYRP_023789 [Tyrophagus putrescentiae]
MIFPESHSPHDGHFRMYEVPVPNYEGSYGQMTLNIKGVPMERYWPPLPRSPRTLLRQTYKTIYHLISTKPARADMSTCEKAPARMLCFNPKAQTLCPNRRCFSRGTTCSFYIDSGMTIYGIESYGPVAGGSMERGKSTVRLTCTTGGGQRKSPKIGAVYKADDFEEELDDPPAASTEKYPPTGT